MNLKYSLASALVLFAASAAAEDASIQSAVAVAQHDTARQELLAAANREHGYLQQTDNEFYSAAEAVDLLSQDVPADAEITAD